MYSETNTSITLHSFFLYSKSPAKQQPQPEISLSEHNRISTCCNQQNTNIKRCCLKQSCHYRPDGKGQRTHIERLKYIFSCRIRQKDQKKGERSSSKQQQEHSNLEVFIVCKSTLLSAWERWKILFTHKRSPTPTDQRAYRSHWFSSWKLLRFWKIISLAPLLTLLSTPKHMIPYGFKTQSSRSPPLTPAVCDILNFVLSDQGSGLQGRKKNSKKTK